MTSARTTKSVSLAKGTVDNASSLVGLETNIGINSHATALNHEETNLLPQLAVFRYEPYLVVLSSLLSTSSILQRFWNSRRLFS
jgi:hypothetical protein